MKKTYINPEMEVVVLNAHQMLLAGSALSIGGSTDTVDSHELEDFNNLLNQ